MGPDGRHSERKSLMQVVAHERLVRVGFRVSGQERIICEISPSAASWGLGQALITDDVVIRWHGTAHNSYSHAFEFREALGDALAVAKRMREIIEDGGKFFSAVGNPDDVRFGLVYGEADYTLGTYLLVKRARDWTYQRDGEPDTLPSRDAVLLDLTGLRNKGLELAGVERRVSVDA